MNNPPIEKKSIRVLFLAADPSNAARLHLGRELQSVRDKLANNEDIDLKDHQAVKPSDVMQEIINYKPHIVHFSGHGLESGELCFEDDEGNSKPIPPEALASLFSLATDDVKCVIVNACFAEKQAQALAKYIPVVIGTNTEISDNAAINFATGFYTALGTDLSQNSLKKAYQLGCIAIQFDSDESEHLTPKFIEGSDELRFTSEVDSAFSMIVEPRGAAFKTMVSGLTLTGQNMGLPDAIVDKIISDKILRLQNYKENISFYESNLKSIINDEYPLSESSEAALTHLQNGLKLTDKDVEAIRARVFSDPKLDSAYSWYYRGNGQKELNNYSKAIEYYSKAIEKTPDYSAAYYNKGNCYSKLGEHMASIEEFSKSIEINKNWEVANSLSSAYFSRGLAYYDIIPVEDDNVRSALADWEKYLELIPEDPDPNAYYNVGLAHMHLRNFPAAIKNIQKSLEEDKVTPLKTKATRASNIVKCYQELGDQKGIEKWTSIGLAYLDGNVEKEPVDGNHAED